MVPMHSKKRKGAFHEPQGAAGILPAEESEQSPADETSAAHCWRPSCGSNGLDRLKPGLQTIRGCMVPMHGHKTAGAFHLFVGYRDFAGSTVPASYQLPRAEIDTPLV